MNLIMNYFKKFVIAAEYYENSKVTYSKLMRSALNKKS